MTCTRSSGGSSSGRHKTIADHNVRMFVGSIAYPGYNAESDFFTIDLAQRHSYSHEAPYLHKYTDKNKNGEKKQEYRAATRIGNDDTNGECSYRCAERDPSAPYSQAWLSHMAYNVIGIWSVCVTSYDMLALLSSRPSESTLYSLRMAIHSNLSQYFLGLNAWFAALGDIG